MQAGPKKDAYFCVPLKKESRKYVWFQWEGTLYEFLCLCFVLGPAPLIFSKILKILNILKIFALEKSSNLCDNIPGRHVTFVTNTTRVMRRDSIVFLQTQLGFCNQFEKFYSIASSANRISRLGERFS